MMRFARLALSALALSVSAPALAQEAAAPVLATDPERVTIATRLAGTILPDGIYKKMFSGVFDQMGNGMMSRIMDVPLRDFAAMAGKNGDDLKAKMGPGTIKQMMEILDPHFNDRIKLMFEMMEPEMATLFTKFEPPMRQGLASAYAAKFSADQLKELEAFFATPTGAAYAGQSMTIFMDPAVMEKMMGVMPEVMKALPAMMPKIMAAMEKFPKARKMSDLNQAERAKLAELFGIPAKELK